MRFSGFRMARSAVVAFVGAGTLVVGLAAPVAPSFASSRPSAAAPASAAPALGRDGARDYLALGDSVSFGYRESATTPPPNYADPASFVGYPEDVGLALGLNVANAACPGETSESLIAAHVPSNGCENAPGGYPGYRTAFPLHVAYQGTQLQFALRYLRSHPRTGLVSLMIGANDTFFCEETTGDHCASELPAVLKQVSTNVAAILGAVRHDAGYRGQIVMVNYYTLDYANPTDTASAEALNEAMDAGALRYGARIADGFGAFQAAAVQSGGNACTAGLLTQLTTGGCGIHPSVAGQAILALSLEEALRH